jgi:membrane associated rhomboid family serine protease
MSMIKEKFATAPVTVVLCALMVGVYGLEVLAAGGISGFMERWALSGDGLARGQWWTLVTHVFVHANLLHLLVNVLALWFMGPEVEWMLGRRRYVILFLLSGIGGGILQTMFAAPVTELVGASGAVCGVLLAFTTAYPEMPLRALLFFVIPVSMKAKTLGRGLVLVSLVCAVLNFFPQVGHLAHLGGALTGALLSRWWIPRRVVRASTPAAARQVWDDLIARVEEGGLEELTPEELQLLARRAERGGGRRTL